MEDVSVQQPVVGGEGEEGLKAKLKAQEEELAKLRQLNELLLERMNKKDKKAVLGGASGSGEGSGENGEKQYEGFEVKKVPVRHEATGEVIDFEHIVTIKDSQLLLYVKSYAVRSLPPSPGLVPH